VPRYDAEVAPGPVFCLNVHASYACRHSGACCTAGWSIPVEPRLRSVIRAEWLVPQDDGGCPEFDRRSSLCRVHRNHGEAMLPESCHHFPRRALIDARGVFVTLSHFCPTAARLLVESDAPLAVIADAPAFPASRGYDGLDARDEWPPLLRPDALFDYESFSAWEQHLVGTLGSSQEGVAATLAGLADTAERLRRWTPACGAMSEWTRAVLNGAARAGDRAALQPYARFTGAAAFLRAASTVASGLDAPRLPEDLARIDAEWVEPRWPASASVILRYLGARAFASWTAYQARGIRAQIAELVVALAVLRVECGRACGRAGRPLDRELLQQAVRASDRLLVHLADREPLMAWIGKVDLDVAPAHP
jgi:hypothetical protein